MAAVPYVYRPHSAKTVEPYERLLVALKRASHYGFEMNTEETATEVIAIARAVGGTEADKKRQLDELFGSSADFSDETARHVLSLCAELDDFVGDAAAPKGPRRKAAAGDSDDDAAADEDDEEEDELDLEEAEDGTDVTRAHRFDYDGDDGDDAAVAAGTTRITIADIDATYLQAQLRRLMPSLSLNECQQRAASIEEFLGNEAESSTVVATQLLMALNAWSEPDVESWVNRLVESRWSVVYGARLAQGTATKADLTAEAKAHAARDPTVAAVVAELTGKSVDAAAAATRAPREHGAKRTVVDMQVVDLEGLKFAEGSRLMATRGKTQVPAGTQRFTHATHEEVVVPPQPAYTGKIDLVPLTAFPDWCRPTFPPAVERLNPMQSTVFPAAFHRDENLLVCAPTGAGKTNVAMTTLLREIAKFRDEANDSFYYDLFKLVYIAPMKALVQEVVRTFGERLAPLGITVDELSGDQNLSAEQLQGTQLIVTTPEKWDIVTRKSMDRGVASQVRVVIIDEIHLLHSERGPVLESVVARTRHSAPECRLVGLSATLPNYKDVAAFMRVNPDTGLHFFDASFRPVPLKQTFCGLKRTRSATKAAATNNDVAYIYAMQYARKAQQVLVFVHGRKDTIATADFIRRKAIKENMEQALVKPDSPTAHKLAQAASEAHNKSLRELLPFGVAFHNAGLRKEDRALVESLFLSRDLVVLVSTSTLAWGVNLPAHGVIIKGTKVFSAAKGGWDDLSALDVFQMFGRAGRPGFDTYGEAVIITAMEDLEFYLSLLTQQLPIESQLMTRVVDVINAEVCLGTIRNIDDAVAWLERTYLHVRMMRAPRLYGIAADEVRRDPTLREHREDIAHTALTILAERELVHYDRRCGAVRGTELGRIASHFYLTEASVATYSKLLLRNPFLDDVDLFRVFSHSDEFSRISVRTDEKAELRRIGDMAPIPLRDGVEVGPSKINLLLQAYISGLTLDGLALMSELVYIRDSALRIVRALLEITLSRGLAWASRKTLELYNMVLRQQWAVQTPLRQFGDAIPSDVLHRVEGRRLDWSAFYYLDVDRGGFSDFAPNSTEQQELLFQYVHRVPRMDIDHCAVQPLTRGQCRVEVVTIPDFEYVAEVHGPVVELLFTVEDANGARLLHRETAVVPGRLLAEQKPVVFTALVRVADPKPTHIYARVCAVGWLGSETSHAVDLLRVPLPEPVPPPTLPRDEEVSVDSDALLWSVFSDEFGCFTMPQSTVLDALYHADGGSAFVAMPYGSGRSVCVDLAVLRFVRECQDAAVDARLVVLLPDAATAQRHMRRTAERLAKLPPGVRPLPVACLSADVPAEDNLRTMASARIVLAPVAAWRAVQRRPRESAALIATVAQYVLDSVHMLADVGQDASTGRCHGAGGAAYECVIARIVAENKERAKKGTAPPADIIATSVPTYNAKDLAEWLGVPSDRLYNFAMDTRRAVVVVEACAVPGRANYWAAEMHRVVRMLEDPKYLVGRVGVFVATSAQAWELAQLLRDALRDDVIVRDPASAKTFEDPRVTEFVAAGIAPLDGATSANDLRDVLRATERASEAMMCVLTADLSAHVTAGTFDHVVVCNVQHDVVMQDIAGAVARDFSPFQLQHMVSRAALSAHVTCVSHRVEWAARAVNDLAPVPSALPVGLNAFVAPYVGPELPPHDATGDVDPDDLAQQNKADAVQRAVADQLRDEVCAWVCEGRCRTMEAVMRALGTLYLAKCTKSNPGAYGLRTNTVDDRSEFFSDVAEQAALSLRKLKSISYNEASLELAPGLFGVAASRHNAPCDAVAQVITLREQATTADLIAMLTAVPHVRALATPRPGEAAQLSRLNDRLPRDARTSAGSGARYFNRPAAKAATLAAAFLCRVKFDDGQRGLLGDMDRIATAVQLLCPPVVDVVARLSWPVAATTMQLAQLLAQRLWVGDSPLLQLPHFDAERVVAAASILSTPEELPDLSDAQRDVVLAGLSDAQVGDVALWCNSLPVVDVAATIAPVPDQAGTFAVRCNLATAVADDETDAASPPAPALCPRAPSLQKLRQLKWWVAITSDDGQGAERLRALRFVHPARHDETFVMKVAADEGEDVARTALTMHVTSANFRLKFRMPVKGA